MDDVTITVFILMAAVMVAQHFQIKRLQHQSRVDRIRLNGLTERESAVLDVTSKNTELVNRVADMVHRDRKAIAIIAEKIDYENSRQETT